MPDRCAWKRCRDTDACVICVGVNGHGYPLCWKHHVRLMEMEGVSSENIVKLAKRRRSP